MKAIVFCLTLLSLLPAAHGALACGTWTAFDTELDFEVTYGCGESGRINVTGPGFFLFEYGPSEVRQLVRVEDDTVFYGREKAGQINGNSFSIGKESYRFEPCPSSEQACPDTEGHSKIWRGNKLIMKADVCQTCVGNTLRPFLEYLVLRHRYLSKIPELYNSEKSTDFDIEKLVAGMKDGNVQAAIALCTHSKGVEISRQLLEENIDSINVIPLAFYVFSQNGKGALAAFEEVMRAMQYKKSKFVRFRIQALGLATLSAIGAANSVPRIIELSGSKNNDVALAASVALGDMGVASGEVVATLIELTSHRTHGVRKAAINALGKLGPDANAALPRLRKIMNKKNDWSGESLLAAKAIGRIDK